MNKDEIWAVATITASDDMPELENGQVDIGNKSFEEVNVEFSSSEFKKILRQTKCYSYTSAPITLYWKFGKGRNVACAGRRCFDTLDEMKDYMVESRPLVYKVIHNTIFDKYMVRVFTIDGTDDVVSFNWKDNLYTNLCIFGLKIKRWFNAK